MTKRKMNGCFCWKDRHRFGLKIGWWILRPAIISIFRPGAAIGLKKRIKKIERFGWLFFMEDLNKFIGQSPLEI